MKSSTKWYIAGAIVIIVAAVVLFRFVKTQGDAISSMPGSASNWFQQTGRSGQEQTPGEQPMILPAK